MRGSLYLALLATASIMPGPAGAQVLPGVAESDFLACDGYPMPGRSAELGNPAISGFSSSWAGNENSRSVRRTTPTFGAHGIGFCDRVLASDWARLDYRLRRASLIEARAMHRLAAGEPREALADLDQAAQTAPPGDALVERSFMLGLRLARAYAQLRLGDNAAAVAASQAVLAARPYEPALAEGAARLQVAASRDWSGYFRNLRNIARINPDVISRLYMLAFYQGAFDDVVALHSQVVLIEAPMVSGGYQVAGDYNIVARSVVRLMAIEGTLAYALLALGRDAEANAVLTRARATLARVMAPPSVEPGNRSLNLAMQSLHFAMVARRAEAMRTLEGWERMVRLRRMVAEGNIPAVIAELGGRPVDAHPAALDLLESVGRAQRPADAALADAIGGLRERIAAEVADATNLSVAALVSRLPEPETAERMPAYREGGRGRDGYRILSDPGAASTILYASGRGTMSVANEMALLRAADLARQGGHRGMLILARRTAPRSTTTTRYGVMDDSVPSGQVVELDVLFVDPQALPAAYADAGWRVLDPEAVWTALSPIYIRPQTSH